MTGASAGRPVVVLSSGGKDSLFMLERLRADPNWQPISLLTTVNESNGRVAMHGTPEVLLRAQAASLGLPLVQVGLPEHCDNTEYERRLAAGMQPLQQRGVAHVACGDLFLADIRRWREALFERLGWRSLFPIWHEPTDLLARRLVSEGWCLTLSCVDTQVLSTDFLGRQLTTDLLADLPAGVDPCGENGEFHTFVSNGPGFEYAVPFELGKIVLTHERYAMLELQPDQDNADN